MKKLSAILTVALMMSYAVACSAESGTAFVPTKHHESQTISGVANGDATDVKLVITDDDGHLLFVQYPGDTAPVNGIVDIPDAGATDRTQLTDTGDAYACTLQAPIGNTGAIYVGGSTVTNSSGANEGIMLMPGWSLPLGTLLSMNEYYVATDNAGDDVKYLCK